MGLHGRQRPGILNKNLWRGRKNLNMLPLPQSSSPRLKNFPISLIVLMVRSIED